MTRAGARSAVTHGPGNAENEIRKAYDSVIETGVGFFWDRRAIPGVNADEVVTIYKHCIQTYYQGNRLAAERWARTAKHLARAFWHEAKIAFIEPRLADLPCLETGEVPLDQLEMKKDLDTTADLLESSAHHIPSKLDEISEKMRRYLNRATRHLKSLEAMENRSDLLFSERVKAAHEYGRTLECMALAYEAEGSSMTAA